jgi:hypothetical protein
VLLLLPKNNCVLVFKTNPLVPTVKLPFEKVTPASVTENASVVPSDCNNCKMKSKTQKNRK